MIQKTTEKKQKILTGDTVEGLNVENSGKVKQKLLKRIWGSLPFLFFILLLFVIAGLFGQINSKKQEIGAERSAKQKELRPEINVVTLKLVPSTIKEQISMPGIVKPWIDLTVASEVRGKVVQKVVKEGIPVQQGDLIAVIDSRDYKNSLTASIASLKAARASLKRLKELDRDNLATRSELDDATARVENLKASVDNDILNVKRCNITAPISGFVNNIMVEKGQYLNIAAPVAQILETSRVKIKVGIPESDVEAVRRIFVFNVKISALNNRTFQANKYFLSKTADTSARVYNLYLELQNPDREILPDMFTRVQIVKKTVHDSISVPIYSVISRNDEHIVYLVDNDQAIKRNVELGLLEGWRIQIKSGLASGEHIIVVGHRSVNHGDKVNTIRTVNDPKDILQ